MCSLLLYSSSHPQFRVCDQCQEVRTCVRQCYGQISTILGSTYTKTCPAYINIVRLCCHNVWVMFGIRTKGPENIWKDVWQNINLWGFCLRHTYNYWCACDKKKNKIFSCSLIFLNESRKDEETLFGWTKSMVLFFCWHFFLTLAHTSCTTKECSPIWVKLLILKTLQTK